MSGSEEGEGEPGAEQESGCPGGLPHQDAACEGGAHQGQQEGERARSHFINTTYNRKTSVCVCVLQDFQTQMVEPSALPLVERLTQEVQELRESLVQQGGPPARGPVPGRDRPNSRQPEFGGGHQRSMGQYL